jgi:hypothetical protein
MFERRFNSLDLLCAHSPSLGAREQVDCFLCSHNRIGHTPRHQLLPLIPFYVAVRLFVLRDRSFCVRV